MSERDYYPAGAYDDPNAPYNEIVPPERDFDVTVSQTLSKSTTLTTSKYLPEVDEEDGKVYTDTSDTDWKEVYNEEAYTPLQLIGKLKDILEEIVAKGQVSGYLLHTYKTLIEECEGWEEDDYEVIEE
jgi:hypothetical protein